jgi:hypothetical protein
MLGPWHANLIEVAGSPAMISTNDRTPQYVIDPESFLFVPLGGLAYIVIVWIGKALVWIIKGFIGRE